MELKNNKPAKLANQFWPFFLFQTVAIVIAAQIIISVIIVMVVTCFDSVRYNTFNFWVLILFIVFLNLCINLFLIIFIMKPTKDLIAAVLHISGEGSTLMPPNPNTRYNEVSGFRDALQTIYELSSKSSAQTDTSNTQLSNQSPAMIDTLNTTACGFIALNSKRQIIYCNKSAPAHVDTDGTRKIDLLFNGIDTLDNWLNDCNEHAVHAEHIWTRIPDRLPNQEGRRFFDIVATYQKGASTETVLTLIDRTSYYAVDEENLDFIAFAAHELRGPITVIKGYLDVLEDELSDKLAEDQHQLFHRLVVSSNRLSGYINNILNTSRYDRRHLKLNLAEESAASIYDIIKDDMQLRAVTQNRMLSVNIPTDLPKIAADSASISEVFGNLIDNAIKYSNEGGVIDVTAKVNGDFVDIAVQDHGIGMPDNVVSQLFQKFYRSHRSRETVAGTGIGLYISKAIVESHGGTIGVRSEDGRGSTFTVSLPIYSTVADKLKQGDNSNVGLINEGKGWIKNHSMYRG